MLNVLNYITRSIDKGDKRLLKGFANFFVEENKRLEQGFNLLETIEGNLQLFSGRIRQYLPPEEILSAMRKKKLLFVDDEKSWCVFFEETAKLLGYEPLTTSDPEKATTIIAKEHPDLVVVDLKMPKVSGLKLLKNIRRRDDSQPLMIITGHPSPRLFKSAEKLKVKSVLIKPVRIKELRDNLAFCLKS